MLVHTRLKICNAVKKAVFSEGLGTRLQPLTKPFGEWHVSNHRSNPMRLVMFLYPLYLFPKDTVARQLSLLIPVECREGET